MINSKIGNAQHMTMFLFFGINGNNNTNALIILCVKFTDYIYRTLNSTKKLKFSYEKLDSCLDTIK
jgi:hypothetical protein